MSEIIYTYTSDGVFKQDTPVLNDAIRVVSLIIKGSVNDEEYSLQTLVDLPSPKPSTFIPFAELTQEQIVQMALDNLAIPTLEAYKKKISNNIA